jgi:hypothetical protein
MSVSDHIATASDKLFAGRTMVLTLKVAHHVLTTETGTGDRLRYASSVIYGDEKPQLVAAHIIAATPAIAGMIDSNAAQLGSNVPDADIEAAITAVWDVRSKAFAQAHPVFMPSPIPPVTP